MTSTMLMSVTDPVPLRVKLAKLLKNAEKEWDSWYPPLDRDENRPETMWHYQADRILEFFDVQDRQDR